MGRISRSSRLQTERIHANYVNRMTNIERTPHIEKIDPIHESQRPFNQFSENYLISYDRYYRSIQELKKEFKRFYHHEKELQQAIARLNDNDQTLIEQTKTLVEKYNLALEALRDFDALAGTDHLQSIHHIYTLFAEDFQAIGVTENEDYSLSLNMDQFLSFLHDAEHAASEFMGRFKAMILKEYQTFIRIKAPDTPADAYESQPLPVKGLLIEEQY
ncbi:hypothetical protein M3212_20645 [Alkalihalobacillus oceani]|uniref:hypothetical protein n=1 Tax=Halalkalibacter oceani TaxID=1653776 RepID=UPI0020421046|nr:hypothetical protein [Halalkalibacter oceani]MCM3763130.1 hypothetical protein [Halalkalibacter oceani]